MSVLETDWWTIELPDEWHAEQEEDLVVIEDEDGVSCLEISCLVREDGAVSEADLQQFSSELMEEGIAPRAIRLEDWNGLLFEHDDNEFHWREWFLRQEAHFVYAGYHCQLQHAGMDDAPVEEILSTLQARTAAS